MFVPAYVKKSMNYHFFSDQMRWLPFNETSSFFSKKDNYGLPPNVLSSLWLFVMRYLKDTIQKEFFPGVMLLHSIAHNGMRLHEDIKVRRICSEYLYRLLNQFHPPRDEFLRRKYLNLFFLEAQDQTCKDFDVNQGWEEFCQLLQEYLSDSPSPGSPFFIQYMIKVLEVDFHFWLDR